MSYPSRFGSVVIVDTGDGGGWTAEVCDAVELLQDHRRTDAYTYDVVWRFGVRDESGNSASCRTVYQLSLEIYML